ncbi:peptide/nickel transport system ATP-binding protein/oligopeptide transport system ATP-binding protein [Arboricoccus pini]|uniref:Peptide/nickel transport system ATP-binding protein/oligopeptide transport system ATP-binding protein n=1 Tax=Arboricoccus pini TaxID=1963835 RepID=A0A212RP50_9PROT|nr:ABC transporter ATP-binding protein [Arboricoccus pini]SNB74318.1 peptide/nickel transport system ATP-binding protein/oligopeptide transport system ATP-binding protein [Arboricoccus pini]
MSTLLSVSGLTTRLLTPAGLLAAVEDVDFTLDERDSLGLVGESGSGKSVTMRSLLRLLPQRAEVEGSVRWRGRELVGLPENALRALRGREIAMIFQEPMSALNPVLRIGLQIEESLKVHTDLDRAGRRARAVELLALTGIPTPERRLDDFPHQFSGGMRQRAMIAIALAASPALLLADEPTTALDVTIQDQILHLLARLRREMGMAMILVTHDLAVVAESCERVAVMYAGRIVERGTVRQVFAAPRHPYTLGLLRSVPDGDRPRQKLRSIEGTPPGLGNRTRGCAFQPRCGFATAQCATDRPPLADIAPGHAAACWQAGRLTDLSREAA